TVREANALCCQSVNVRCFDFLLAVTPQIAISKVIRQDKDDARLADRRRHHAGGVTRWAESHTRSGQPGPHNPPPTFPNPSNYSLHKMQFEESVATRPTQSSACIQAHSRQFESRMAPDPESTSQREPSESATTASPARRGRRSRRGGRGRGRGPRERYR